MDRYPGALSRAGTVTRTAAGRLRQLRRRLGERLLWGVPWGTLLVCCVLLFVYLVVQNGAARWGQPLVLPFTSWSYGHPLGVVFGPISHVGPDHLSDNLFGTLVFGSLAEYVFSHRPTGRTDALWNRPHARALVVFPAGALLVGVLASLFAWGPTVGFSNVVYAFAGFALVRFPLGTVLAVPVREALAVVGRAIDRPFVVATATPASDPWFVNTAVQGHAFGLLVGVVAGLLVAAARDEALPPPRRLWTGVAVFALVQSLWVVWWPQDGAYVLGRALGVLLVACLATVVTVGAVLTDTESRRNWQAGIVVCLVPLAVMAGIAVPVNATADVTTPPGTESVDVGGYDVTYAEDVTNQRLAPFAAVSGAEPTTSGVLVVQPDSGVWTRAVDASTLASEGTATIRLGGLGWERTVFVLRRSWQTTGGETAYQVRIHPNHGRLHRVYASPPATASPVVAGYNVTLVPDGIRFRLDVSRDNETVGSVGVPAPGETVAVGDLRVHREGDRLVAVANDTRVPIARRE